MAEKKKKAGTSLPPKVIIQKVKSLKSDRGNWESNWQDIADLILPRKNEIITKRTDGEQKNIQIYDNTGIVSVELLAGALQGILTNPNSPWFEFTTGDLELDRNDDVRKYLQEAARRIHSILNNTNFQSEAHEYYLDLGAFNTANLLVEEVEGDELVRFVSQFIANYYIDEDHLGRVNQVYKEWKWSAEKLVQAFGVENLPEKIQDCHYKGKPEEFSIIHAVYPEILIPGYASTAKPFVSQYILVDLNETIKEERFFEMPYVVSRWAKASGEKYGRGPGMNSLPEVKTLNKMAEIVLKGAQKVIDPPLQLPDDGFIMPIRTKPGSLNYYRAGSNDRITPVFNDTRIDFGFQALQEKRMRVREAFYIDQLTSPAAGPARTATEVMQRAEEQTRLMGPILGRQLEEFARPTIDRVFGIAQRRGKLPVPPAILNKVNVKVRFTSLMARSQRVADANAMMRTLQSSMPLAQFDPSVLDNIDANATLKAFADIYGFPQEALRTQAQVTQIRNQRAQAQQAAMANAQKQQELQNMQDMSKTMGDLSGEG